MIDPATGLFPVSVDLWYDDQWNDITDDIDVSDGIRISRGRADYQSAASPSRCSMTLLNRDGKYSPKNPLSPMFRKLGRNTPVRVRVGEPEYALSLSGDSTAVRPSALFSTYRPEFNVSAGVDIRIDLEPDSWRPSAPQIVASRLLAGTHPEGFLWDLRLLTDGSLRFQWYEADGQARGLTVPASTLPGSGRACVRFTVEPGTGGGPITWATYTGESEDGPWTVIESGPRSVAPPRHGTAPVVLGASSDGNDGWTSTDPFAGRVYGFQLRDGVDGPVVASLLPDPVRVSPSGLGSSYTSADGTEWTPRGTARLGDVSGAVRFAGFVNAWPPRWSGPDDVRTDLEAYGYRRLVDHATAALRSPMYRACTNPSERERVLGYWPMEDGRDATEFASGIGGPPMLVGRIPGYHVRDIRFAAYDGFRASLPVAEFSETAAVASLPSSEPTGEFRVFMLAHGTEEGLDSDRRIFSVATTGSIAEWSVIWRASDDSVYIRGRDSADTVVYESNGVSLGIRGVNALFGLWLVQSGPDIAVQLFRMLEDDATIWVYNRTVPGATLGAPTTVTLAPRSGLKGTALGHLTVMNRDTQPLWGPIVDGFRGYFAEPASDRVRRVCAEEGIPAVVHPGLSEPLDVQPADTLSGLLDGAAESDMGALFDSRATASLEYRPRVSHYNQDPFILDYRSDPIVAPFEPTDDDDLIENDITVTRQNAGSSRAVELSGPLAATPPPDGVGRYEASYSLSLADDAQTEPQAHWRLHMGTLDELRYPKVSVALHDRPKLAADVRLLDVGDRLQVTNLPAWLPPNTADLIIQGYDEWLNGIEWLWTANGTPGSSWSVGVSDDATYGRADTSGAELLDGVDDSTTDLPVLTTDGPIWIEDPDHFPFDANVGGEIVTVVGVRSLLSDDFNRGDVGEWDVSVWDAGYWNTLVWGE